MTQHIFFERYLLTLHGIVVAIGLIIYVAVARSLPQRRDPSAAIAWVVALALLPYVALPLYLLFGSRKLRMPNGDTRIVADGLRFPNGIAISPDNRRLVVAEMDGNCLAEYDIAPDGDLNFRRRYGHAEQHDRLVDRRVREMHRERREDCAPAGNVGRFRGNSRNQPLWRRLRHRLRQRRKGTANQSRGRRAGEQSHLGHSPRALA